MIEVKVTWPEVMQAAQCGVMRHLSALWAGREDQHGFEGDGWSEHIIGALGELAFCKAFGLYWTPTVNTFKAVADVGARIEVRARRQHWHELNVRPDDKLDRIFVLVTGTPPLLCVRGWKVGTDCCRDEWWHDYGKRPHAWFVPQSELEQLETLRITKEGNTA